MSRHESSLFSTKESRPVSTSVPSYMAMTAAAKRKRKLTRYDEARTVSVFLEDHLYTFSYHNFQLFLDSQFLFNRI